MSQSNVFFIARNFKMTVLDGYIYLNLKSSQSYLHIYVQTRGTQIGTKPSNKARLGNTKQECLL